MMARREMVMGLGAAALGTALSPAVRASDDPSNDVDVLIVGAGVAGLAAAHRLRLQKRSFLLVEARDRIGGRTWTETATFGLPIDVGAQWLHNGDSNPFVRVAKQLSIPLAVSDRAKGWLFRHGERTDGGQVEAYLAAEQTLMKRALAVLDTGGDMSLLQLAQGDRWLELIAAQIGAADSAQDAARVSVRDIGQISLLRELDHDVAGGVGGLVALWGRDVPVSLGTSVTHIDWSGSGVQARGTFGSIRARAAIITVPTSLLSAGRITFTPSLPVPTQESFANLPLGLMLKVSLRLSQQLAEFPPYGADLSIIESGMPHAAHIDPKQPVITVMVGGTQAWDFERQGTAAGVAFATDVLAGIAGNAARRLVVGSHVSGWGADPWSLGSYTAASVGHADARTIYSQPVADRLWFAGEASANDQASTVGGAYLAGEKAAREVVQGLEASQNLNPSKESHA